MSYDNNGIRHGPILLLALEFGGLLRPSVHGRFAIGLPFASPIDQRSWPTSHPFHRPTKWCPPVISSFVLIQHHPNVSPPQSCLSLSSPKRLPEKMGRFETSGETRSWFQLWVSRAVSFMASLATRPAPTTKSSARANLGCSRRCQAPEIASSTCVTLW